MKVVHSINGNGKVCDFCGFTDEFLYQGVDCIAQFGGAFLTLCGMCDELNEMFWDMADIVRQFDAKRV